MLAAAGAGSSGSAWVWGLAIGVPALLVVAFVVWALLRGYRVEASFKATTQASRVSLAAGASLLAFSASAAAILGGPGVVAVHFRSRELWRKQTADASLDALLAWIDGKLSEPEEPPSRAARMVARAKEWLFARTDMGELPALGGRILLDLRDLDFGGSLVCGFADPGTTGKAAALLYPLAGVLAPLGRFTIELDWSGRTRLDGGAELAFAFVPARILSALARFGARHVHPMRTPPPSPPSSSTLPERIPT